MSGEFVIRDDGSLGVEDTGNAADQGVAQVFTGNPDECGCCDPCENANPKPHKILHSWVSNGTFGAENPRLATENLRPYRDKGEHFRFWRIVEGNISFNANGCFSGSSGSQYESGVIVNGELIGLPDEWQSSYYYDGFIKLVVFCIMCS